MALRSTVTWVSMPTSESLLFYISHGCAFVTGCGVNLVKREGYFNGSETQLGKMCNNAQLRDSSARHSMQATFALLSFRFWNRLRFFFKGT